MNTGIHFDYNRQIDTNTKIGTPHNKALFTLTNLVPNCSCSWRRMSGNVIKFFVKFLSGSLSYNQYSDFTVLTSAGSCIHCDSVFNMQKFT